MKRSPMPMRKVPLANRPRWMGSDMASRPDESAEVLVAAGAPRRVVCAPVTRREPRPDRSAEFESFTPERRASILRLCSATTRPHVSVPKVEPVRHEGYRRLVALLPCLMCGIERYSQAAHPNTSKGAGTKTDDRLCFPLCADRPGVRGCHPQFDQGAHFTKEQRRITEPRWGRITRERIRDMGLWPADLEWIE